MSEPPVLAITDLTVHFPRRKMPVLRNVSFEIGHGEQVIVLGASGSGKSTLLHTITGVIPHSVTAQMDGDARLVGEDTLGSEVNELSLRVGILTQDPTSALCLPDVEQEVALPLENRAVPRAVIDDRVTAALAAVSATSLRHRATGELSGGQAQRVALAASVVGNQPLLLLDEPTSMLDSAGIADVRDAIRSASATYAPAVILVEHRIDEFAGADGVDALPARALVLGSDGAVLADGPTAEVLHRWGPHLHAQGCWLPLSTELEAVFGIPGDLRKPQMRDALRSLVTPLMTVTGKNQMKQGLLALDANGLCVAHTRAATAEEGFVLANINVRLMTGETTVVLGANGSGKTSLMLTLAGLVQPARGTITGARPGMIFQNPEHQFVGGSVRAEVAYGLPASAGPRVDALLATHGLDHLADAIPHRLSGGEKRRLSIAAMLAHQRDTLIADEPFYGLDRRGAIGAIAAFRGAAAEGRAVLFSCHDLRTAVTLAERAIVVAEGTIIADGPVIEVLRDSDIRRRSGLTLPPLLEVLFEEFDGPDGAEQIRQVLDGLNSAVSVVTR